MSENDKIMSNTSADGIWRENYTMLTWHERYRRQGGYPVYFFRVIG